MNSFGKRMLILAGFGAGLAVLLVLAQAILSTRQPTVSQSAGTPAQKAPEKNPARDESFSLPPAPPARPAAPAAPEQKDTKGQTPAPAGTKRGHASLKDLFASGQPAANVTIDTKELEELIRDHISRTHPDLKLSDADYERLATAFKTYREANLRMQTMERVSSNSGVFRQSLQEMAAATKEFKQITGSAPGEFFMEGEPPVIFGNTTQESDDDDETDPEFLPDHKP